MNKIGVKILSLIITMLLVCCGFSACSKPQDNKKPNDNIDPNNTLTATQQVAKAKEILSKTHLTQSAMTANIAKLTAKTQADTLTKAQIIDILNKQGLKALATGNASDFGMTNDQIQKLFIAQYTILHTSIFQLLEQFGETAFNQLYKPEYILAEQLTDYLILFNPIAIRGVAKITDGAKTGYTVSATSTYTDNTSGANYVMKGYILIKYFDDTDYSIALGVEAISSSEIYTVDYYTFDNKTKEFQESCINKTDRGLNIYAFFNDKAIPDSTFKTAQTELTDALKNNIHKDFTAMETACEKNHGAIKSTEPLTTFTNADGVNAPIKITVDNPF